MEFANKSIDQIAKANSIALVCHLRPDVDALGSMVALKRLIKKNFETENHIVEIDMFSQFDNLDEKLSPIINHEILNQQKKARYDLCITLDCADYSRMGDCHDVFDNAIDTLNIDHHDTNVKFAKNNVVSKNCSSTCEVIYLLYCKLFGWHYSTDICSLLYSGIITDTNNLSQNLGPNTLKTAFELTEMCREENIDLEALRDYFFNNNTKEQLSLLGRALQSLSFREKGQIATMTILKNDFAKTHASQEDTIGIVDYLCTLHNVKIGILFIMRDDDTYYISIRSKKDIDVGTIATQMGGGGHKNIAAFHTLPNDNINTIKEKLFDLCKWALDNNNHDEEKIENLFDE